MENGVCNLTHHLSPEHFDIHICCLRKGGAIGARLKRPSQLYELKKAPGLSISCVQHLREVVLRLQPDILHTHNLGPLIYSSLALKLGKKRKIIHGEHAELTASELVFRRKLIRKYLYRGCDAVHSVSAQLTETLRKQGFRHRNLHTIPNGVDTDKFYPAKEKSIAKQQLQIPCVNDDSFLIGSVGRFGPHKGHAVLIPAFENLASMHPKAILVLAGDGGSEKIRTLNIISKSKYKNRIHWLGFQEDMTPVYQAMDLLVSPSFNEGMSNVILESMACSIPVLANESCGITEIVSSTGGGTAASIREPSELTKLIFHLSRKSDELKAQGEAGRQAVVTMFSIEKMANSYGQLYYQTASRPPLTGQKSFLTPYNTSSI